MAASGPASAIEQATPPQARVAPEPAVERDQFCPLLERQSCQVGIRYEIAPQVELTTQAREARPVANAGRDDLRGRVQQRVT